MQEVIAVIRNEKWQATRTALEELDFEQLIHKRVMGRGRQRGLRYLRRAADAGEGEMPFLPKRMLVCIVRDEVCQLVIDAILAVNQTGNMGDGKIFVRPIEVSEGLLGQKNSKLPLAAGV
jgi:nitrogen regulatory protein PII 2